MRNIHLANAADWHANIATTAYVKGDLATYCKHIVIADRLWAKSWSAA